MIKRILLILALCSAGSYAAENPSPNSTPGTTAASDESIRQLLEVAQARKLVDSVMKQMDTLMLQTIQEATRGQPIPPKVQKQVDKNQAEVVALLKDVLDWKKLEPMYVRVYQKTFSQQEVDGMIAFYKTPSGQAVIGKMPTVMQNTMEEMQSMMGPVMQKMQKMQQDVIAEMKAETKNKGGG